MGKNPHLLEDGKKRPKCLVRQQTCQRAKLAPCRKTMGILLVVVSGWTQERRVPCAHWALLFGVCWVMEYPGGVGVGSPSWLRPGEAWSCLREGWEQGWGRSAVNKERLFAPSSWCCCSLRTRGVCAVLCQPQTCPKIGAGLWLSPLLGMDTLAPSLTRVPVPFAGIAPFPSVAGTAWSSPAGMGAAGATAPAPCSSPGLGHEERWEARAALRWVPGVANPELGPRPQAPPHPQFWVTGVRVTSETL